MKNVPLHLGCVLTAVPRRQRTPRRALYGRKHRRSNAVASLINENCDRLERRPTDDAHYEHEQKEPRRSGF